MLCYRSINNGKLFFSIPRYISEDLGDGLKLWKEFYQSQIIGWKPYINMDGKYYYQVFAIY